MRLSHSILYLIILFSFILTGCNKNKPVGNENSITEEYRIYYAKGFHVKKYDGFTDVSVVNPWDTTKLLQKYILVDRNNEIPENIPQGIIIRTPLKSVATYNTLQCAILEELESPHIIKGVFEPEYIKLKDLNDKVRKGIIEDLGSAAKPDIEKLIMLSPEAIFASPIAGQTYGNVEKTRIPVIETPDYTETDPLGRAEWIRFYSLFIGKEALADSLFNITVERYNEIKETTANASSKPTVFLDTKYQNNWNTPGGKSYMANMFADSGAEYIWSDNTSTTFMPLSFETVLDKAGDADIWLIRYFATEDMTYKSLEKEFKQYSYFKSFKERNIYGCNTSYSSYFEDSAIHPDLILKDMAFIFHPDLFPGYQPRYYNKLK